MEKRILGRTGLSIKSLCFGGMELEHLDERQANILLNTALDSGLNYVDTSPEYVRSEELIGKSIGHRRGEYILATKCGDNMTGVGPVYKFDKETLLSNLENSLKLLKTDYIDVWQLHAVVPEFFPDGEADEAVQVMLDARKQGKVRFLGATIRNGKPSEELYPAGFGYNSILEFGSWKSMDVIQLVYGGMTRMSENVIAKTFSEYGTGIIARGVIKKYKENYDELFEKSGLAGLLSEGETKTAFLIRYALSHPGISSLVIGTKSVGHLLENIKTADHGKLPTDVYEEAKRCLDAVGITAGKA